jgi:excisionase family DNA binding protein
MNQHTVTSPIPPLERLTCSVEEAQDILGLGRGSTYAAVKRGDIPSIRIGGRCLVLVAPLREMLALPKIELKAWQ